MKPWKAILAVLLIFTAGVITGAVITKGRPPTKAAAAPPPFPGGPPRNSDRRRDQFLKRMDHELNLTQPQRDKIGKILTESHERMAKLWEPVAPKAKEEFQRVHDQIVLELTKDQKITFEEKFKPPVEGERRDWRDGDRPDHPGPKKKGGPEEGVPKGNSPEGKPVSGRCPSQCSDCAG